MISVLLDRNNFIKNLLTAKSNDFKSLFVSAKHSTIIFCSAENGIFAKVLRSASEEVVPGSAAFEACLNCWR